MPSPLALRNDPSELARLGGWVQELAAALRLGDRDRSRVDLALAEAVANTIVHCGRRATRIAVAAEGETGALSVSVVDDGPGFDPLAAPERVPASRLEDAEAGGWGLGLIRAYSDELRYERRNGENRLNLYFRLGAPRP